MNDGDLIELLLENYTEQYNIYKFLLDNINAGIPTGDTPPDVSKIIKILEERRKSFDRIKEIDDGIKPYKIDWEKRKNEVDSVLAETLKTLLKNIKEILSKVMEANERLEEIMNKALRKA